MNDFLYFIVVINIDVCSCARIYMCIKYVYLSQIQTLLYFILVINIDVGSCARIYMCINYVS